MDPFILQGRICTKIENGKSLFVDAIVIDNKRIVFSGSKMDSEQFVKESLANKEVQVISLPDDSIALSGFQDAHIHPLHGNSLSSIT